MSEISKQMDLLRVGLEVVSDLMSLYPGCSSSHIVTS